MFDGANPGVEALFIAPVDLARWADHVSPHLRKMADSSKGRYETADLFTALAGGRMQLWIAIEGPQVLCVMLSEVHTYPKLRALRLVGLSGYRPARWRHLLTLVEKAAVEKFGCTMMEAMHIPRFGIVLPGFRTTHWFSEKVIG